MSSIRRRVLVVVDVPAEHDAARFADAAEAVGEPGVDVEGEGGLFQGGESAVVEGDGVFGEGAGDASAGSCARENCMISFSWNSTPMSAERW